MQALPTADGDIRYSSCRISDVHSRATESLPARQVVRRVEKGEKNQFYSTCNLYASWSGDRARVPESCPAWAGKGPVLALSNMAFPGFGPVTRERRNMRKRHAGATGAMFDITQVGSTMIPARSVSAHGKQCVMHMKSSPEPPARTI